MDHVSDDVLISTLPRFLEAPDLVSFLSCSTKTKALEKRIFAELVRIEFGVSCLSGEDPVALYKSRWRKEWLSENCAVVNEQMVV